MYKNQKRYQPKNRSNGGFQGYNNKRNGFGFGQRRTIKKLDERFFIKKAVVSEVSATEPVSTASFADYAIDDKLKRNIADKGYTTPTPIQEKTIPTILEGRDVIGIANTGT